MPKTILITGATDGIGLEAAKLFAATGDRVLIHGRNPAKLQAARDQLVGGPVEMFQADLTDLGEVARLAAEVSAAHDQLDVLINNAGVLKAPQPVLPNGQDIRFVVNTVAPYLLTRRLLPLMGPGGRVVNLSSAAQADVDLKALVGGKAMADMDAYSQSKLAITMWSRALAAELGTSGPAVIAVNPGSLLASKMVKEGFGIAGNDLSIGAEILLRAATGDNFANASGRYWDNDSGRFAEMNRAGLNDAKTKELIAVLDEMIA